MKTNHHNFALCRICLFVLIAICFLAQSCNDQSGSRFEVIEAATPSQAVKEKWHWDDPKKQSETAGYAQVVKVGNTLYISGVPTDDLSPDGIRRLYNGLRQSLDSFGASPEDVVKETLYTTDIEAMKMYNDARKEFYQGDYPAASWVQVSRLYEPKAKLEVDLVAIMTDK